MNKKYIYLRDKDKFRFVNVLCSKCGRKIEAAEETLNKWKSESNKGCFEIFKTI